jgi:hypothetical protein
MDKQPSRVPSEGCLLYLAADRLIPHRMSLITLRVMTKVPCTRGWVHPIRLSAVVLTATFLTLQQRGTLDLRIQETSRKLFPGARRFRTDTALAMTVLDPTPQPGVPGVLLTVALAATDGRTGTPVQIRPQVGEVLHKCVAYPFIRRAVQAELLELGYFTKSHRVLLRPDCTRIAALQAPCAAAVSWWQRLQVAEAALCTLLLGICRRASTPESGGG